MEKLKLNNKGITTIEILICFILLAVISTSLYSTVSNYRNKQILESEKEKIYTYKNLLTKEIQDDIIKKGIKNAVKNSNTVLTLTFSDDSTKQLQINVDNNVITYGGIKYPLPDFGKGKKGVNEIKILQIKNPPYFKISVLDPSNLEDIKYIEPISGEIDHTSVLQINIPFEHPDFGDKYGILIVAPFNYTS